MHVPSNRDGHRLGPLAAPIRRGKKNVERVYRPRGSVMDEVPTCRTNRQRIKHERRDQRPAKSRRQGVWSLGVSKASIRKRIDGSGDRSIQEDNRDEQKERRRETKECNGRLPATQLHVPLPLLLAGPGYRPPRQERRARTHRPPIHGITEALERAKQRTIGRELRRQFRGCADRR